MVGSAFWTRAYSTMRWLPAAFVLMAAAPDSQPGAQPSLAIVVIPAANGLDIKARSLLPPLPIASKPPAQCAPDVVAPTTPAGRAVAARGWVVTGEARMGAFQAVSFAGRLQPVGDGNGGTVCTIENGNVGIFQGAVLKAIAYAPHLAHASIGKLTAREGDGIRLWSGEAISMPVADIDATPAGLQLGGLAPRERMCAGKAVVPNIYGMSIDKARVVLTARGWTAVPGDERAPKACSAGLAYCAFRFRSGGVGLSVSTMGDDTVPGVMSYSAHCP